MIPAHDALPCLPRGHPGWRHERHRRRRDAGHLPGHRGAGPFPADGQRHQHGGSLAGRLWGYRRHLHGARPWLRLLTWPSLLGGTVGALLLLGTGEDRFARIVPFLVLAGTLLFMLQKPILRALGRTPEEAGEEPRFRGRFVVAQFAVGIYGGYFGAGIGILMLAVLEMMGHRNIHRMNGLKNWGGMCINVVAALLFIASGIVHWPIALALAVGG
ncbi:MAG: sulfite exporter TauE/SafE family protein, partial [Gemmatimonadales bacterium]|nr:sulfite exporter TauE/SafE family protein [Gemmatimonadales bacterium]